MDAIMSITLTKSEARTVIYALEQAIIHITEELQSASCTMYADTYDSYLACPGEAIMMREQLFHIHRLLEEIKEGYEITKEGTL